MNPDLDLRTLRKWILASEQWNIKVFNLALLAVSFYNKHYILYSFSTYGFLHKIYKQEQIRNCILAVKSSSEQKIEKIFMKKRKPTHSTLLYLFILSLLNCMAVSQRYVWWITYCFFALELTFNILGLAVKIIRKFFSYKKTNQITLKVWPLHLVIWHFSGRPFLIKYSSGLLG